MIEAKSLTKYYGPVAAIEGVSFEVGQGEIVGFLGPNGAGKTSTMRILTGFSPATKGTAVVAGFDVHTHPVEVKRRVGYLPESVPLYGEMVVERFLDYVASIKGVPSKERRTECGRVMERCGLSHMAKRVIGNLSKGYRQRVGLAQALIASPPVLILDEPTVGLDPKQIIEIREMIKSLAADHTVLISTHILPEVTMVCQRAIIINRGRVVAQDSMENLTAGDRMRLEIRASGGSEPIDTILRSLSGVHEVTSDGDAYLVSAKRRTGLAEDAVSRMVAAGCAVGAVHERSRTLEDTFIEAISRSESEPS